LATQEILQEARYIPRAENDMSNAIAMKQQEAENDLRAPTSRRDASLIRSLAAPWRWPSAIAVSLAQIGVNVILYLVAPKLLR